MAVQHSPKNVFICYYRPPPPDQLQHHPGSCQLSSFVLDSEKFLNNQSGLPQALCCFALTITNTHLSGLSPPIGEVAVLQLLRPPSSLSFFLRSGAGTYPLWLLLLGKYWLKGMAVRGSLTDVRRANMSSLRTSGIFLCGAPSDSESLPRPVKGRRRGMKKLVYY